MRHLALGIPELQDEIMAYAPRSDLTRVARVCSSFWLVAAPRIWCKLDDFRHMVHLMNWKGLIAREANGNLVRRP